MSHLFSWGEKRLMSEANTADEKKRDQIQVINAARSQHEDGVVLN